MHKRTKCTGVSPVDRANPLPKSVLYRPSVLKRKKTNKSNRQQKILCREVERNEIKGSPGPGICRRKKEYHVKGG